MQAGSGAILETDLFPVRTSWLLHFQTENLPGLALGKNLEGTAAHFAIRGEPLLLDAGINRQVELLAAERALNGSRNFHNVKRD